ncbi:MAG: LuxR family transcriptional regulator [Aliidongia sp.]
MDNTFQQFMAKLCLCSDRLSVEMLFQETLSGYGFYYATYFTFNNYNNIDQIFTISTYPPVWWQKYCESRYDHIDPIISRVHHSTLPFIWSIDDDWGPLTKLQQRFFREAEEHGICHGFTIPIHDQHNRAANLTVAAADHYRQFVERAESFRHELHLIALYLHAHIQRWLLPGGQVEQPVLTEREIECIQWVARGKSANDIADILQIKPRTVTFHVENAKRKFGVASLPQAVAKAITQDLISAQ